MNLDKLILIRELADELIVQAEEESKPYSEAIREMIQDVPAKPLPEYLPYPEEYNEYGWSAPYENGGRVYVSTMEIRKQLEAGDRAERYYAAVTPKYHRTYIALMPGEMPQPEEVAHYKRIQALQLFMFPDRLAGEVDGNLWMLWAGNAGFQQARERYEAWWDWTNAFSNRLKGEKYEAKQLMRQMDKAYFLAVDKEQFRFDHPGYEPE